MPDDKTYGFNREDTIELINLIGNSDVEFTEVVPQNGSSSAMIVWTPISGIPAASMTTTTLTLGSASCYRTTRSGSVVTKGSDVVTVYNTVTQAIGADSPIQVKLLSTGIWVVDVEICGVSDGDGPDPNPPMALGFDDEDDDFFLRV